MRKTALMVLLLTCAGCFRIAYQVNPPAGETYKTRYWNAYFVAGLIPVEEEYALERVCPLGGVSEVRSFLSPPNVLATILGVLVSASSVEAVCLKEPPKQSAPAAASVPGGRPRLWPF